MKTAKRENKPGTVRCLHPAHDVWDPVKGRAASMAPLTFGRGGALDRDAVKRPIASPSRLLEPGSAPAVTAASDLEFISSCAFSGPASLLRRAADLTKRWTERLAALGVPHPKQVIKLQSTPR